MSGFKRELGGPGDHTSATGGVVDTSTAQAIAGLGEAAYKVGAGMAVSGLTGEASTAGEVDPIYTGPMADPEQLAYLQKDTQNFTHLAQQRRAGLLSGSQTEVRAAAKLKQDINKRGGLYANELRGAYNKFFGSGPGGGASLFKPTPSEQAAMEYRVKIEDMARNLGWSFEAAEEAFVIANNEQRQIEDLERKTKLHSGDVVSYSSKRFNTLGRNLMAEIMAKAANSPGNVLSPEDINLFRSKALLIAQREQDHQYGFSKEKGVKADGTIATTIETESDDFVSTIKEFLDNTDMQKLMASNKQIAQDGIVIDSIKNFRDTAVIRQAGGEELVKLAVQASYDSDYRALIMGEDESNVGPGPDAIRYLERSRIAAGRRGLTKKPDNLTSEEKKGLKGYLKYPEMAELIQDKLPTLTAEDPYTNKFFTNKGWRDAVKNKKADPENIALALESGLHGMNLKHMGGGKPMLRNIKIQEITDFNGNTPRSSFRVLDENNNVIDDSLVVTVITDTINAAKNIPETWKGKYDSPMEFVTAKFNPVLEHSRNPVGPPEDVAGPPESGRGSDPGMTAFEATAAAMESGLLRDTSSKKTEGVKSSTPQEKGDGRESLINDMVSIYRTEEGDKPHTDSAGIKTQAYGVVDDRGVKRLGGESDSEYAGRVFDVYLGDLEKLGKDNWDGLSTGTKKAIADLHYNSGLSKEDTPTLWKMIKEGSASEIDMLKQTLDTAGSTAADSAKTPVVVPGLALRRARRWNEAGVGDNIDKTRMTRKGNTTLIEYLNGKDVVFNYTSGRKIYLGMDENDKPIFVDFDEREVQ